MVVKLCFFTIGQLHQHCHAYTLHGSVTNFTNDIFLVALIISYNKQCSACYYFSPIKFAVNCNLTFTQSVY